MANYVSNYTGTEIDAGIAKANTAVQEYNIEDYVVVDYEHPTVSTSAFSSYPLTITEANYNALKNIILAGKHLYYEIAQNGGRARMYMNVEMYDNEEEYIVIGTAFGVCYSDTTMTSVQYSYYISGHSLDGFNNQCQQDYDYSS